MRTVDVMHKRGVVEHTECDCCRRAAAHIARLERALRMRSATMRDGERLRAIAGNELDAMRRRKKK